MILMFMSEIDIDTETPEICYNVFHRVALILPLWLAYLLVLHLQYFLIST
jgi:hypothetical protein